MGGPMRGRGRLGFAGLVVLGALLVVSARARAEGAPEAFARVVVDASDVRSGPGISYRIIARVARGETLAVDGRPAAGYWLRVVLDDGRTGFVLGDAVQVFAVSPDEPDAPSRPSLFATPPLEGARAGLALVGGLLRVPVRGGDARSFGYMEARPSIVVHRTVTLDGFVGDALTADGSQFFYGGGATIHFAPSWAACPFLGIGGGRLHVRPNTDSFVLARDDLFLARAGGGLLMALRGRILVRLEVTNMTLFDTDKFKNAQTYSMGFGVYF